MFTDFRTKWKNKFTHPRRAYLTVIGGFIIQLTLGGVYSYGNMAPYMVLYMQNYTEPLNHINVGNSMWIFGLCIFGLGASMSFGGFIEPKIGTSVTILLGSWMMSFGVIITFWTIRSHLALVALSYGLIVGLGVGIAYGVILSVPSEWFPNSKGLVTGIVVGGFGLGAIIFDFPQSYFINPDFLTGEIQIKSPNNLRFSFLVTGIICALIQLVGSCLIRRPVVPVTRIQFADIVSFDEASKYEEQGSHVDIRTYQLIFERDFWILWISYTFNSVVVVMILSLHKSFGNTLKILDGHLTVASAGGALFNGLGRILWGYLNDKIPYKVLMSILSLCMALMLSTFYLCTLVQGNNGVVMYFAWVIVLHFFLSGNFSLFPTVCAQTFGMKNFAGNYGLLFTGYSFAGVMTSVLTTGLLKTDEQKSYLAPFLIGSIFSLISAIITLFYRGKSLMYKREMF